MESPLTPPPSPFLSIWLKPRETIRRLVETNPTKYVIPLAILGGIYSALAQVSSSNMGDSTSLLGILAIGLVGGTIGGIIALYVGASLYRWAGGVLGGQAYTEEVRTVLAWANVPTIVTLPLFLVVTLLLGNEMFAMTTPRLEANPLLTIPLLAFVLVQGVMGIWSFVILVQGLSEVHRFSVWRALGSLFLGGVAVFVPVFICVFGLLLMA